jgi:hypothetical protein
MGKIVPVPRQARDDGKGDVALRGRAHFDVTDEVVAHAVDGLRETGRPTAARELEKAIAALSKRPQADTRGAVRFAAGAMEAIARDITGDRNATLSCRAAIVLGSRRTGVRR